MHTGQFVLPIQIDLAATFLFGLTGALAALRRGYDVIGLFALAFVTGVGGGLIRDGLFIQQGPPAVTADSRFILVVLLAGCVAFLFRDRVIGLNRMIAWLNALGVDARLLGDRVIRFNKVIAWLDALGLGAYAVVGVQKSLLAGLSVAAAILVGVINAAGGGLLRDVLVRDEPLLFKPGQFYVMAAFTGCLLFTLLTLFFQMEATPAALITISTTFVFRVLAIQFNWVTPPLWQAPIPQMHSAETPPSGLQRSQAPGEPSLSEKRLTPNPQTKPMDNLTVLAFDDPTRAFQLRDALVKLQGESLFNLTDAVVVTRDAAGKVQLHQTANPVAGCASAGSVAGLIVGAIFMLPWVGSAVGTGVGAVLGALSDLGIDDRFVKDLGATLTPDTSALVLLGSKAQLDELGERVGPLLKGCILLQTTVNTDREVQIRKLLEKQ